MITEGCSSIPQQQWFCYDEELSNRMERTALLWKAVHMVSAVRKWSEEVDYQGLAMRYQAEEFVFFVCFGSLISHLIHFVLCKHASGLSLQDGTKMELVCKDDLSPGSEAQGELTLWWIQFHCQRSWVRWEAVGPFGQAFWVNDVNELRIAALWGLLKAVCVIYAKVLFALKKR